MRNNGIKETTKIINALSKRESSYMKMKRELYARLENNYYEACEHEPIEEINPTNLKPMIHCKICKKELFR